MGGTVGPTMDVASIVNELMKRQSVQLNRLSYEEKEQEVKLSLYSQLKNIVDNVNKSITDINNAFHAIGYSVTTGNSSILSGSITQNENVYAATHQLTVTSLAQSETLTSNTHFNSRNQALNLDGNLGFTIGSNTFAVNITATDTLENVRDKINSASNNVGVTASLIASTDQNGNATYSLVVASDETGVANKFSISGSLDATFDISNEISAAQDAVFTIDGMNVVRSRNTVNDVLDGVSFTLLGVGQSSLTIAQNNTDKNKAIGAAIQEMVDAYNNVMDYIDQSLADRTLTDSSVTMIKVSVHALFASKLSNVGGFTSLFDVGVKTAEAVKSQTKNGSAYTAGDRLVLDKNALQGILATKSEQLEKFFMDQTNGFTKLATKSINGISQFGGIIANKTQSINEYISKIERRIGDEESRLENVRTALTKRYSDLSTMMDKFDRLSGMLDNIFSHLTFTSKK